MMQERLFIIGMWWRIGYGTLRIILGLALLKIIGAPFIDVVTTLMHYELVEDPHDAFYIFLSTLLTEHPMNVTYFLAGYFIVAGAIEVVLSYNLIARKLWVFPVSLIAMGALVLFGFLRFTHTHSSVLLMVICIDIGVLWLIWREYMRIKSARVAE